MTKFNRPVPLRQPDTSTAEGGIGFSREPKDELFTLGLANMVGEDTFYETGASRDQRFETLIHEITASDPAWMQSFIGWLRSDANMRSAPIVAAAEYVRAGGPNGRQVIDSVLQRPDEPAELLGYWLTKHGRKIPMPIKRGIADAIVKRLYHEGTILKYDGQSKAIRWGDVIELTHPKAKDSAQSALFRHAIDRRHDRPVVLSELPPLLARDHYLMHLRPEVRRGALGDAVANGWTWERLAGWLPGGMDAEAWEAVIPNMGLMALVRNLRNFDKVGLSDQVAHQITSRFLDAEEVHKSRQFPLRFLTAWKAVTSLRWGMALEGALQHSLGNVPRLKGRTLVLVDVSPSMRDYALSQRTDDRVDYSITPRRWEVAGLFGAALAQRAEHADVVLFDFNPVATATVNSADSVMRFVEQCGQWANKSNGTDILGALARTYNSHDRVVILTDEQQGYQRGRVQTGWNNYERYGWDDVEHVKVPVFTFNLGGYKTGVTPNERNWYTYGGLSDACFGLIPIVERRRSGQWPWDVAPAAAETRP